MSVDVLGPGSAINSITTRPTQVTTYGATRTWFKACTSLTTQDGTQLTNDWLNNILAQLRTAYDGTGIVEDNGDDMLLRAIESIGIRYGTDVGTVNALAVTFSPPVTALTANLTLAVVVGTTNTLAATINPNALGVTPIVGNDGNAISEGQMVGAQVAFLQYNSGKFQLLNPVTPKLAANATYWVGGTGASDSNDGLSATVTGGHGPFATLTKAAATIALVNLNGYNITINVADGGYAGVSWPAMAGSGQVILVGDNTNPQNVLVTAASAVGAAAMSFNGGSYTISGFRVSAPSPAYDGVECGAGNVTIVGPMHYGGCNRGQITAQGTGNIILGSGSTHLIDAGYTNQWHIGALIGGQISIVNPPGGAGYPTLTIAGNVTFTNAFVACSELGQCLVVYASITGASNVNGLKFSVSTNALIGTLGSGASYYPGTTAGSQTSGGQYT